MKFQFHDSTRYFDAVVSEVVVDQEDWAESASLLVQPGAMRETTCSLQTRFEAGRQAVLQSSSLVG